MDAARLAEIHPGGQFAYNHDIKTGDHFPLERREIGQCIEALRRTQIGKQIHFLAQSQKPPLGLHAKVKIIVFRSTHRTKKHGVAGLRLRQGIVVQRSAVNIIGAASDKVLADLEFQL